MTVRLRDHVWIFVCSRKDWTVVPSNSDSAFIALRTILCSLLLAPSRPYGSTAMHALAAVFGPLIEAAMIIGG